jgi:2-C-methyl-D-erythritol 2,4-cyclodiphosphate synthase
VERVIRAAARHGAAVAALPASDTLKREGAGGLVAATVPRAGLWQAQTPQAVRADLIPEWLAALAGGDVTDDVQPLESLGHHVKLVPGSRRTVKVTWPEDLAMANELAGGGTRAGVGFDMHRLAPGRRLVLGGVPILFPQGLAGHSDADIVCHALTDAVLGATGGGDIGTRFGVRREATRNLSSVKFLATVVREAAVRGWKIVNADVTVVAEAPKIGPYRDRMARVLSRALGIPAVDVSIKATTAKKVGVIGHGEAMACFALVSVVGPVISPS